MKIRKAIIPAAGFGTRVLPATKSMPKEMFPIVDKPTIQYIIEEAVASGADIHSQVQLQDFSNHRMLVRETDIGKQLEDQVRNLKKLLYAYRHGILRESYPDEE